MNHVFKKCALACCLAAVLSCFSGGLHADPHSDVLWFIGVIKRDNNRVFCPPAKVTVRQILKIVKDYADARGIQAITEAEVCAAVSAVYPCGVGLNTPVSSLRDGRVGNFHSYHVQSQGNLAATRALGCVDVNAVTSMDTPVDLFNAAAACAGQGAYARAAALIRVGTIFGRYDIERVKDRTSHDAIEVLRMGLAGKLSQDQVAKVDAAMKAEAHLPGFSGALCEAMSKLGPPRYRPNYMIFHGMNTFMGGTPGGEFVEPFNAEAVWQKDFSGYLSCGDGDKNK